MGLLLLVVLILLLIGALPTWRYSRRWCYLPSGAVTLVVVIIVGLMFLGYIPRGF